MAARHGAAKQVWISIGGDEQAIRVTVEDDGIGFTDTGGGVSFDSEQKIFSLFYSTKGSSGFGLWSARRYALANNGNLSVKNTPGAGATFTLKLPKAIDKNQMKQLPDRNL